MDFGIQYLNHIYMIFYQSALVNKNDIIGNVF